MPDKGENGTKTFKQRKTFGKLKKNQSILIFYVIDRLISYDYKYEYDYRI